jgi:DnaJ homolog subfamily C member 19
MTKLLWLVVLAVVACRVLFGKWPWQLFSGQFLSTKPNRQREIEQARRKLGVQADASRQDILDAHRRIITEVHPDRGGSNERVHEVNEARDLLLDTLATRN